MIVLRAANLALSFLLELGMIAALGLWGYDAGSPEWVAIVLGAAIPIVVAVIWGVFMAPKARIPLSPTAHLVVALVLFGLATIGLLAIGQIVLAVIFAAFVILNQALTYVWRS